MKRAIGLLTVAVIATGTLGNPSPDTREEKRKRYQEQSDKQRHSVIQDVQKRIDKLQEELTEVARTPVRTGDSTSQAAKRRRANALRAQLNRLRARRDRLQQNDPPFVPTIDLNAKLAVGQIGTLQLGPDPAERIEVRHTLTEQSLWVVHKYRISDLNAPNFGQTQYHEPLLITGVPTADLQPGQTIRLDQVFEIIGTREHRDAEGHTGQVLVAERFDMSIVDSGLSPGAKPTTRPTTRPTARE